MKEYGDKYNVGYRVLASYQHECDNLEIRQNGMGDMGNVRNGLIRGETRYF